jgi:NAD(P)H-dependent FMN reductase
MPGRPPYEHEVVKTRTAELTGPDGFIFGTPEYSYGPATVRWRVPVRRRW